MALALAAIGMIGTESDAACPSRAAYATLRYEEDYSFLREASCRTDPWDGLKYMPIDREGDIYLSVGGDARVKYEYIRNSLWGQAAQDGDGYVLQRYLVHGDLHVTQYARAFVQLESALEEGRQGGPRAIDEDQLDLNQAFLDGVAPLGDSGSLTLRVGRQELAYGAQRLVSVREVPNVRRTFDAVRLILTMPDLRIDGFASHPVEVHSGIFNDRPNGARSFWGLYAVTGSPLPDSHTDLYYLGLSNDQAHFNQGRASEVRHTLGTRLWGLLGEWDYNVELMYQVGTFGQGNIRAWGAASDTGFTLSMAPWRPRLAVRANILSGDRNPGDRDLQTFNAFFPRASSYFGELPILGPANLVNIQPYIELHPVESLTITLDADSFRRQSDRDGIYSPAGILLRSGLRSRAMHVGERMAIQVEWRVDRHFSIVANYTHFFAGQFIRETGPSKDTDYTTAWLQYRF